MEFDLFGQPHAGRGAGGDHVARLQGDELGDKGDGFGGGEDHLAGAGILVQGTVMPELHRQAIRVGHFVGSGQPRPHRAKGIEPFTHLPVKKPVTFLQRQGGTESKFSPRNIVKNGIAPNVAGRIGHRNIAACFANDNG